MRRSLRAKLVFIMLLLIVMLMTVVLTFLIRGVGNFFEDEFNARMETAFSETAMLSGIYESADIPDAPMHIAEVVSAYAGQLGVDRIARRFYILDGVTAQVLVGLTGDETFDLLSITPTILSALDDMEGGYVYTGSSGEYMDAAASFRGAEGRYIVYIRDDRSTTETLASQIFTMIIEAVALGFAVSAAISLILSQTLLAPIRGMTRAAEAMADGDFSAKIPVESEDEIGTLATTFNAMASQLEQNLDELRLSEMTRREFVANVSHEMRTPLASIRSCAETLENWDDMELSERETFLGIILSESDRMTNIVQDLLQLSRFDADMAQMESEPFDLAKSVRDVFSALQPVAERQHQTMSLELPPELPNIVGDRARIEQVLMNIIANAVKYTPDGGLITVTARCADGFARVTITDTGIGIPEDDLARVFDRFYRVDKARSRESGGTGLGLSIAHEIVARHGGEIIPHSVVGVGTSFTVSLPIEGASA
ncbi:MAG: cell wall metabolism sensor histidine kinase WalK [Oscillospiraceae bacterium]|jgi:signal transduction histidine kinase|nr:cell wall metabolism sensor histidine kinase WalK [Oscillospiraceae bacterium]